MDVPPSVRVALERGVRTGSERRAGPPSSLRGERWAEDVELKEKRPCPPRGIVRPLSATEPEPKSTGWLTAF